MTRRNLYYNYIGYPNYYAPGGNLNFQEVLEEENAAEYAKQVANQKENKFLDAMNNNGGGWASAIAPAATNIANAFLDTEASTADRVAGAMGIPVLAKQWTADTTKGDKYLKGLALQNTGIKKPNYIQDASSAWGANNAIKLNAQNNISPISSESALPSLKDFKGNWWRNTGAAVAQGAAAGSVGGPWGALGGAVTGLLGSIGGLFGRQKRANAAYKDFLARRDTLMSARQAQFNKANIDQTLSNMQALANGNTQQRINDMANIRAYGGNLFDGGGDLTDEQQMVLADIQADPRILFTPKYSQWRDYIRRTSPDYLDRLYASLPYEQQQDIYQNDREAWGALSNEAKGRYGAEGSRRTMNEAGKYTGAAMGIVGMAPAMETVAMFPMLENGLNTYFGYEGAKNLPTAVTNAYDYAKKGDWSRAGLSAGEAVLDGIFIGNGIKGVKNLSELSGLSDRIYNTFPIFDPYTTSGATFGYHGTSALDRLLGTISRRNGFTYKPEIPEFHRRLRINEPNDMRFDENGNFILSSGRTGEGHDGIVNFATSEPARGHRSHKTLSGIDDYIVNPEALKNQEFISIEPSDTFFETSELSINPKDITLVSGDTKLLDYAKSKGFNTLSSPRLREYYRKNHAKPTTSGKNSNKFSITKEGADVSPRDVGDEIQRLTSKRGAPTLEDYRFFENETGLPSGVVPIEEYNAVGQQALYGHSPSLRANLNWNNVAYDPATQVESLYRKAKINPNDAEAVKKYNDYIDNLKRINNNTKYAMGGNLYPDGGDIDPYYPESQDPTAVNWLSDWYRQRPEQMQNTFKPTRYNDYSFTLPKPNISGEYESIEDIPSNRSVGLETRKYNDINEYNNALYHNLIDRAASPSILYRMDLPSDIKGVYSASGLYEREKELPIEDINKSTKIIEFIDNFKATHNNQSPKLEDYEAAGLNPLDLTGMFTTQIETGKLPKVANTISYNMREVPAYANPEEDYYDAETLSNRIHETNHVIQNDNRGISRSLSNIVNMNKQTAAGIIPNLYLDSPEEIHSRMMQLRYETGLKPTDVITQDFINNNKDKIKALNLDRYTDQSLINLLNNVVDNSTNNYNNIAAMGGNLYTDLSPNMMSLWNNKQQIDQQKVNMQQMNFGLGNSFNQKLNTFDYGGSMNGMDLPTGMQSYDNGGTHEQNPYGGIQVGVDQQGNPNLVEEGEFRWGDYVFSDRISVDPTLLSRYNLAPATKHQGKKANKGKLSYADMAKKYAKKNNELANDPIGKNTLEAYMKRLQDAQEDQKFQDSMEQQKQDAINQYRNALTTPQQGNPMYGAMKYNGMGNAATQQGVNAGMSDLGQQGGGNEVLSNTNRSGNNMLHALGGNLFWRGGRTLNPPPYGDPESRIDYAMSYTGNPIIPNGNSRIDYANQFLQGNQPVNDYGVSDFMNRIYSGNVGYGSPKANTTVAQTQTPQNFKEWALWQHDNGNKPYVGSVNTGVEPDAFALQAQGRIADGSTTNADYTTGYNGTANTNTGRNLTDGIKRNTTTTFDTAATKEDPKQVPHYSTAGEYAMFGKGFTPMLYDWMNKTNTKYDPNQRPAYELADMGNNSTFLRTADTIGGYRAPNLMDVERMNNAAQAQGIAALQTALNVGNGNRGFAAAQTAQNAYNTRMGIGNNYATAQQANNEERYKTDAYNTAIDQFNANARNTSYQDNQKAQQIGQQMAIDTKKAANDYILRNELYADATNRQAMDNRAANQATWTDNALNYFIAQAQKNDILNAKNNDITNPYWTDKNGVMHYIGDSGLNSAIYDAFTSDKDEWGDYAVNNGTFSGDRLKAWNALQEKYSAADLKAHPELWKSLVLQEKQARKEEAEKADKAKSERVANARYAFDNNMAQLNNYRTLYGDKFKNSQWYDDLMKRYNDKANAAEFNDINNLDYWNRIMGDEIDYWRRYNTPVTANQSAYGGYINNNNKSNKREYYNYMRR